MSNEPFGKETLSQPISQENQLRNFSNQRRCARDLVLKRANLRRICLPGLRADGLDLEEADLRESGLSRANWTACILRDARLEAADFTEAVLRLCDLDHARADNAVFARARVENSTARGALFDGANLTGAVLTDTDFSRASFRGAILENISASGTDFRGADFRGARLRNAVLIDADLRGADLTNADLEGVDLSGADLRGVVGDNPALRQDDSAWGALPLEMRRLTETMTPIVIEVLRTAGRRGVIDPATAQRLVEEASRQRSLSPRNASSTDTLEAVSQVLDELGDNVLPTLISALQQPNDSEPPAEVKAMILRLQQTFGLDETASVEDALERLVHGSKRSSRQTS